MRVARVGCEICESVVSDKIAQPGTRARLRAQFCSIFKSEPLMLDASLGKKEQEMRGSRKLINHRIFPILAYKTQF